MQNSDITNQNRIQWVDFVRALGAFLVVLAHIQYSGAGSGLISISYYALTRIAVPLFFMVSGYLLLSKNEPLLDFFRKRALKVFVPFLIWSVIYLLWKEEALDKPLLEIVKVYILKIIRGPRENHLWFFYELFGLYLFTPILRLYVQKAGVKDLLYFCGIWFLLVPVANLFYEFTPVKFGFSSQFLGGYIGYFIFGHLAGGFQFEKSHKYMALILFIVGLMATIAGMYLRQYYKSDTQYFEDYLSVNVVLMACSSFILIQGLAVSEKVYRFILPLGNASFGIYLAHVIVVTEVFTIPIFAEWASRGTGIYMIPLLGVIGYFLSFLLIYLLQRIPIIRIMVP